MKIKSQKELIALIVLFVFAIIYRLYHVTTVGVEDSDAFYYWYIAINWLEGNRDISMHYRPIVHLYNMISIWFFGYEEWALKIPTIFFDLIGLVFIYLNAKIISKNSLVAILSTALFAFLPESASHSRKELVHNTSAAFVSASFFFLLLEIKKPSSDFKKSFYPLLITSGILLSLAAHIHPDIAVMGLGFFFSISLTWWIKVRNSSLDLSQIISMFFRKQMSFIFGYALIFGVFFSIYGLSEVLSSIAAGASFQQRAYIGPIDKILRFFELAISYPAFLVGPIASILFWVGALLPLFQRFYQNLKFPKLFWTLYFIPIVHLFALTLVSRSHLARLYMPSQPFVLIAIFSISAWVLREKKFKPYFLVSLAVLIYITAGKHKLLTKDFNVSYFKRVHQQFQVNPSEDEKVLITPIVHYYPAGGFKIPFYFGKSAFYLKDILEKIPYDDSGAARLSDLIQKEKIRYIFFSHEKHDFREVSDRKDPDKVERTRKQFLTAYGESIEDYSLEFEKKLLMKIIQRFGGKKIQEFKEGQVFDLFPNR